MFFYGGGEQLIEFLIEISNLFKKVGVDSKNIIQCLELKSYFAGGNFFDGIILEMPKEQSTIAKIEKSLEDYTIFPNDFLSEIKQYNILIGYKIIYDFLRLKKLRTIIIVWSPVSIKNFLRRTEISSNVLEAYAFVRIVGGYGDTGVPETTYNDVANVIICEFNQLKDYNKWMDEFYEFSTDINCLTILIEDRLSENWMTISNFYEFQKICEMYKCSNKGFIIGQPIFYSDEPGINKDICLDFDVLNRHGLICGIPHSGKTSTATLLAEEAKREGIGVHIIDVEREQIFINYQLIDNDNFLKGDISLEKLRGEISRYDVKEATEAIKESLIINLLDKFLELPESNEMTHLLLIDEFNAIKSENILKKLTEALDRVRKRGVGIWCMSQSLKHFEEADLHYLLRNKVIHQLVEGDISLLDNIIKKSYINLGIYNYGFSESVTKLKKGQAYVIFVDNNNNLKQPIKVKIRKGI